MRQGLGTDRSTDLDPVRPHTLHRTGYVGSHTESSHGLQSHRQSVRQIARSFAGPPDPDFGCAWAAAVAFNEPSLSARFELLAVKMRHALGG